jgi:UDP-N-acetylmuramoyl-tripeptide--D-alanyl-D-alanine ligase
VTVWTEALVRDVLGLPAIDGPGLTFSGIATDTRALDAGALFVALTGDRFDGHDYLEQALQSGAVGAVVRTGTAPVSGLVLLEVPDPLVALGDLARRRRDGITGPVVAITGSNGKTSTKEMVAAVLATGFETHATSANLNNLIGVPLTILAAPEGTQALVLEAGASEPGEIARARQIIAPTIGIITNVGAAHLEGFGSLEGVMAEKLDLIRGVEFAVVGTQPPELAARARAVAGRVITAGLAEADVVPESPVAYDDQGRATLRLGHLSFTMPVPGAHIAANATLAWALVDELSLEPIKAAAALEDVRLPGGRSEVRQEGGFTILDDCYNANPESFRATIATISRMRHPGRIVWVVGTMRELGGQAPAYHAEVAKALVDSGPDLVAGLGEFTAPLEDLRSRLGHRLVTAPSVPELAQALGPRLHPGDLVVLKASRGVALEGILPYLLDPASSQNG